MIYYLKKKLLVALNTLLFFWLLGIICAPLLANSNISWQKVLSQLIYFFYQPVCHQLSERCIMIDSYPMAVCVRCFAFYFSGLFVSLYYTFHVRIRMWELRTYFIFMLPVVCDFLFEKLGLYQDLSMVRFVTGGILGIIFFHLLVISISKKEYRLKVKIKAISE